MNARGPAYRSVLLAMIPLVLLAGWLYLYGHSHVVDTTEQSRTLALLQDLKQRDSDWSVDVLRSHTDLNPNYDPLVAPLRHFADGLAQLRLGDLQQDHLEDALAEVSQAVDAKATLVDAFKAQNSLFKNSLRYVPTAHRDIQAQLRREHSASLAALDGELSFLVNESLRYSAVPDGEVATSLRSGIAALRNRRADDAPQVREAVTNLLSHLDTLLRLRARQSDLLRAISQVPVATRIDALAAGFTLRFNAELASQFRYQRLLLAYSAFALLLVTSGTGFIWYRNMTERRRLRALVDEQTQALQELATRDDLTRVPNRRHMAELLTQQMAQHARSGQSLCLALLDLDRFKAINDGHGHAAGDVVLQHFAAVARQTLRAADLLGRWGGEEFMVAFPQTSLAQATQVLQRLREVLAKANFPGFTCELRVSFSGGLVLLAADETLAAAVARADLAMYRAKAGGRDRLELG